MKVLILSDLHLELRCDLASLAAVAAAAEVDNAGIQFQVTKGFKLAAVYKHEARKGSVDMPLPPHVANMRTNEVGVWGQLEF